MNYDGLIAIRYPCECKCKCNQNFRPVSEGPWTMMICDACLVSAVTDGAHGERSWPASRSDTRPRRYEMLIPEYDHHYKGCGPNPGRGPDAPDTCELCLGEGKVLVVPTYLTAVDPQQLGNTDESAGSSVTLLAPVTLDDIVCPVCGGDGAVY
jgi:hypothetical protein